MRFELILSVWIILFILWLLLILYIFLYLKINHKNNIHFFPNLFFIAKKETQNYYIKKEIKLEDFYFEALIKIFNDQKLKYKKIEISLNYFQNANIIIFLAIIFFSFLIPIAYFEFITPNAEYFGTFLVLGLVFYLLLLFTFIFSAWILRIIYWKYLAITELSVNNIERWKNKNKDFSNEKIFISLPELKEISNKPKPRNFLISRDQKFWYFFKFKIAYNNEAKEYFASYEQYLYFLMVLPYNTIKINATKVTQNFIKNLDK